MSNSKGEQSCIICKVPFLCHRKKKHVCFDLPSFFNVRSSIFYGEILSAKTDPYGQIVYACLIMHNSLKSLFYLTNISCLFLVVPVILHKLSPSPSILLAAYHKDRVVLKPFCALRNVNTQKCISTTQIVKQH